MRIFLKEDAIEFLKTDKLEKLIQRYSGFIGFPIYLFKKEKDGDVEDKWIQLNRDQAIWLRDPHEVMHDEYVQFYRTLAKRENSPLDWLHFRAEGQVNFKSILYVPEEVPASYRSDYKKSKSDVKLYVRRVMISESDKGLLPRYLSFVPGVVDSDELDLNVNREGIQQEKSMKVINEKMVKRLLDLFAEINRFNETDEDELDVDDEELDSMEPEQREAELAKAREKQLQEKKQKFE